MATRRDRLRRETMREIAAAADQHLREHGAAGLSLRAVAREVGMSPAGLYRYVDGRDDLLTLLIRSGYDDLADHLLVAVGAPDDELADPDVRPDAPAWAVAPDAAPEDRLRAVCRAYRAWAMTNPNRFALLYGDPVPGYEAPDTGVTTDANTRVGTALLTPIVELALAGRGRPLPATDGEALTPAMARFVPQLPDGVDAPTAATVLLLWGRLHGVVWLELNGQLAFLFDDDASPLLDACVEGMVADITA